MGKLMEMLYPDAWVSSTYKIPFEKLYKRGYRGVIFDDEIVIFIRYKLNFYYSMFVFFWKMEISSGMFKVGISYSVIIKMCECFMRKIFMGLILIGLLGTSVVYYVRTYSQVAEVLAGTVKKKEIKHSPHKSTYDIIK